MHVVFGPATSITRQTQNSEGNVVSVVVEAEKRCRFCLGLQAKSAHPPDDQPDPVCPKPGVPYRGHDWTTMVNPVTNFLRQVIVDFWKRECTAYAVAHPEAGTATLQVQDLPMVERQILKNKLDAQLRLSQRNLYDSLGYTVRLQFSKPGKGK